MRFCISLFRHFLVNDFGKRRGRGASFLDAVLELHAGMTAIAERFVIGGPAAAERHSIAHLMAFAVGGLDWNPPLDPERPAAAERGIFDDTDRWFQRLLDFLPRCLVVNNEAC